MIAAQHIAAEPPMPQVTGVSADDHEASSQVGSTRPRFYWALIQAPPGAVGGGRRGKAGGRGARQRAEALPLQPGLEADLADQVPIDVRELHAVAIDLPADSGATAPTNTVLVCAASRSELTALRSTLPQAEQVSPSAIPAFFERVEPRVASIEPARFNLLVGNFEPQSRIRARVRTHARAAACLLVCSALVAIGLERRARSWREDANDVGTHTQRWLAQLPETAAHRSRPLHPPGQPRSPALAEEWASRFGAAQAALTQAGLIQPALASSGSSPSHADAASLLADLLGAWPRIGDPGFKPLNLSVSERTITLSVLFESGSDAGPFLSAFSPPRGWMLNEPRLSRSDPTTTRVQLTLYRAPGPEGENTP